LFAANVVMPSTAVGTIFDTGGASGLSLGFNGDGLLEMEAGGLSFTYDAENFMSKEMTFYGVADPSGNVIKMYYTNKGGGPCVYMGETSGSLTNWSDAGTGTVGIAEEVRFYDNESDPSVAIGTVWSDNPALIIRDYLLEDFGLAEEVANINQDLFEYSAVVCDRLSLGAKEYTCNGSFTLDTSPEDIIRTLLSSMGGIFWNYGGQWAVVPAEYRVPRIRLDHDDLRSGIQVATKHSRSDNFNVVRGQYRGAETLYQAEDYAEVITAIYLEQDNNIRAVSELDLLFTDTNNMAQRIARTFLRRNREQITVVASFGLGALDAKIGDNILLTVDHMGWTDKVFEVVDWRMSIADQDILVNMILRENSEAVYEGLIEAFTDESGNALFGESNEPLEAIIN